MLRDRVSALRDANIYEPQRYRHLISHRIPGLLLPLPACEGEVGADGRDGSGPDLLEVTANFLVVRTMQDGGMCPVRGWSLRRPDRRIGPAGNSPRDVVLDSRQIDTLLAIPL